MKIGDTLHLTPTFDKECDVLDGGPRPCRVVYIHPLERFYVVEFTSDVGVPWRETFYFENRRIGHVNDRSAPRLPVWKGQRKR